MSGYPDAVEKAYATTIIVSGSLPALRYYEEALKATESPAFHAVRLQILLRMASRFTHHREVQAQSAYQEALDLVESMSPHPGSLGHLLEEYSELLGRMGDKDQAAQLLIRATSEPASEPLPRPIYVLDDSTVPPDDALPEIRQVVDAACELIRGGYYESGKSLADQAFSMAEHHLRLVRYGQWYPLDLIAYAYAQAGRVQDAAETASRMLAMSERYWGPDAPAIAIPLERAAQFYLAESRMLPTARELIQRAAAHRRGDRRGRLRRNEFH